MLYCGQRYRQAVALPTWLKKKNWFYHGTGNSRAAKKILASCELRPQGIKRGPLAALPGRVYLTDSLEYVQNFVFAMASGSNCNIDRRQVDKYGYLFAVEAAALADVILDEDWVGWLVAQGHPPWVTDLFEIFQQQYAREFAAMHRGETTEEFLDRLDSLNIAAMAIAGRFVLRHADDAVLTRLLNAARRDDYLAISHAGPVPIAAAWRIPKCLARGDFPSNQKELDRLAERIPLSC
jgi:hypothetical protein